MSYRKFLSSFLPTTKHK